MNPTGKMKMENLKIFFLSTFLTFHGCNIPQKNHMLADGPGKIAKNILQLSTSRPSFSQVI